MFLTQVRIFLHPFFYFIMICFDQSNFMFHDTLDCTSPREQHTLPAKRYRKSTPPPIFEHDLSFKISLATQAQAQA